MRDAHPQFVTPRIPGTPSPYDRVCAHAPVQSTNSSRATCAPPSRPCTTPRSGRSSPAVFPPPCVPCRKWRGACGCSCCRWGVGFGARAPWLVRACVRRRHNDDPASKAKIADFVKAFQINTDEIARPLAEVRTRVVARATPWASRTRVARCLACSSPTSMHSSTVSCDRECASLRTGSTQACSCRPPTRAW